MREKFAFERSGVGLPNFGNWQSAGRLSHASLGLHNIRLRPAQLPDKRVDRPISFCALDLDSFADSVGMILRTAEKSVLLRVQDRAALSRS